MDDYVSLRELVRKFSNLYEIAIHSDKDYIEILHMQLEPVLLFVKNTVNNIYVLSEFEYKNYLMKMLFLYILDKKSKKITNLTEKYPLVF